MGDGMKRGEEHTHHAKDVVKQPEDVGQPEQKDGEKRMNVFTRLKDRLSFGATLVAVAAVAIFIGWLIGQYAIQSVTGPPRTVESLQRPASTEMSDADGRFDDRVAAGASHDEIRERPSSLPAVTGSTLTPIDSTSTEQTSPSSRPMSPAATEAPATEDIATQSPPPSATPQPEAPSASTGSIWRVQAGAFSERGRAEDLVAQLKARGFEAAVVTSSPPYRVQVGAFREEARARSVVQQLHADGFEGFVVPPN